MNGIELVTKEREEQIRKHGFDKEHDSKNEERDMIRAALFLLTNEDEYYPKTWQYKYYEKFRDKLASGNREEIYKVAAALIIAEIDKIIEQDKIDKPF